MKRIGILTAGGDTPALNATIFGAVARANQLRIEVIGLIKGFNCLFDARVPHLPLNPLFSTIPELDATYGGTVLGASRDFVDPNDTAALSRIADRLARLKVEGLICIGGDGTLNGLQPLCDMLPTVLAPKTIDNDLGLNYANEADEWMRQPAENTEGYKYVRQPPRNTLDLEQMINYATPGYATAVFVSVSGVERLRTTAESHRRVGIVEVMGRHSGYIALGSSYGQPDLVLVPECPLNIERLVDRVKEIYDLQQNVVIVCGEGIVGPDGVELGAEKAVRDPAGNVSLTGAAEALRNVLIERIGDNYFSRYGDSARNAIFTRKIGHTQRGGRPLLFDRFYASQLGGKAVDMLLEGQNNGVSTLKWSRTQGFQVSSIDANKLRDRWGMIHAREMHPAFYDAEGMKPSKLGIEYLMPIFTSAIGHDDVEHMRQTMFDSGNLGRPYHSVNIDIGRRTKYLSNPAER
ncbi:MAG: 6-phosphofructokinase [Planctomycetes bacterium]|nr:6-phosphofructokinase [Planctomycetota bacterium]